VRVPEQTGARIPGKLFGHPGVGVGVVAERPQLFLTEIAATARNRKRHDNPIADRKARVVFANFHDLAHELVTEHVAALHRRYEPVEQVQIRSADSG
jgi:hypothetical protein